MKGIYGLAIAIALGIGGALLNFAYLNMKSRDVEKEYFIGIKPDVSLSRGDKIQAEHLEKVGIPKLSVGNLTDFAVRQADQQTVIGSPVWRTIVGPRLLLSEDLKSPPPHELKLDKDEYAMWIPIDTRAFVPSLVVPGDQVSFLVSRYSADSPTPAVRPDPDTPVPATDGGKASKPAGPVEIIGPFTVLSLGNRLGSADVMRAAGISQQSENVMTVLVRKQTPGEVEKAEKLWNLLQATNFRNVGVRLDKHVVSNKE
jgi:hypothetical protein